MLERARTLIHPDLTCCEHLSLLLSSVPAEFRKKTRHLQFRVPFDFWERYVDETEPEYAESFFGDLSAILREYAYKYGHLTWAGIELVVDDELQDEIALDSPTPARKACRHAVAA